MPDIQASHPLSQAIYEGVLEKPPWKTLLKSLEEYMNVSSATLVLRRPQSSDPGMTVYLYAGSDTGSGALKDFRTKAYRDSPFAKLPQGKVFTLFDRVTRSELNALEFNNYLNDYGVSDLVGFDVADPSSHLRLRIRLVRLNGAPAFSSEDRARFESIVPLMSKALQLYSAYTHNSFIEEFYEDLLGSMDIASVIVNAKLEVFSANQQAQQIFSASDGVFLRRRSLHCTNSADQKKLEQACRDLLEASCDDEHARRTISIAINRTSTDTKWDVHIRTVPKHNVVFDTGGPELVLLLQGPVRECAPSQARLMDVFGVTQAEAKLIAHLVDGLTLTAAAEALGVSRNTARTQLSSVFGKTGVNRQTQLVKLVSDTFATHWL